MIRLQRYFFACAAVTALVGCTPSAHKVPDAIPTPPPSAVVAILGQLPDSDGSVTVRSGADVILTGKDSDGKGLAITSFTFTPLDSTSGQVHLYQQTENTVSFIAPTPLAADSPLTLKYRMTITLADGKTATDDATIHVLRVPDPDEFLLNNVNTSASSVYLAVVAATQSTIAALGGADVPFAISVQKRVQYRAIGDQPGAALHSLPIGTAQQYAGVWRNSAGTAAASTWLASGPTVAYQDPVFRLRPPRVNADEINDAVLCNGKPSATCTFPPATAANGTADPRQLMIQEADIDSAEAYYDITLTGSPPSSGVALALAVPSTVAAAGFVSVTSVACAGSTPGTTSTCLTVARNDILSTVKLSAAVVESFATADAYYKTVDAVTGIGASRETLNAWLTDNCFSLTQVGYGADLSATYLNNFDLGFGREMYFKTDCATGTTGATIDTAHGERASIVYNYTLLEGAIQRTAPFLAVAMEFRADAGDPARRKYTRFYTFAPTADGSGWTRVRSANFDGRGEKFTPGNCTVCHGGKPRDLIAAYSAHQTSGTAIAAATADLGAEFLPWDVKSLLFADPGSGTDVDPTLAPGYLATDQQPHISDLNLKGALSTMIDQAGDSTNGALRRGNLRALVCSSWYGGTLGSAVPANQQSAVPVCNGAGSYNPGASGWPTTPNTGGKYSPDQLYTKVIAQQCRSCHMQRISEPDYSQTAAAGALVDAVAPQFAQYADLALRVTDGFTNPAGNTVLHDMQSGILFRRHVMPGSRLTSDRFWAGFGAPADPSCTLAGKTTAACVLAQYFDSTKSDQDFVPAPDPVTSVIADNPPPVPAAGPITSSAFGSGPGAGSALASSFSWTLAVPATAPAGAVQNSVLTQIANQVPGLLVGDTTPQVAFVPPLSGFYTLSLSVDDSVGQPSATSATQTIAINRVPVAPTCAVSVTSLGAPVTIDLLGAGSCSGLVPGDGVTTVPASSIGVTGVSVDANDFATTPLAASGPAGACTGTGCVTISNYDLTASSSGSSFSVNFAVQDSYSPLTADGSGDVAAGTIAVTVNPEAAWSLQAATYPVVAPAVTAPTCTAGTVGPPVTQPSCSARQPVSVTVPLAGPITADALTLPSPYFIKVEIVAAPSNSNPRSTAPTTGQVSIAQPGGNSTPASVTLSYTPPSAWVNNAAQSASNGDSFTYRFDVYAGNPTDPSPVLVSRSAIGTITVSVPPLPGASFASNVVTGISGGPCVACHSPSAPQYVVVTGPPSYASSWNDSGAANGTLYDVYTGGPSSTHPCPQSVSGGADTTDTNYRCANVDNVPNSLLLLKPRNPGAPIYHFGGTQLTTADALYQTFFMWIFDGAWND